MKSLQTKFLAVNICAMAVLALLTGSTGIFTTTRLLRKDAEQMMQMQCDVQRVQLDLMLNSVEQSVEIMEGQCLAELADVKQFVNDPEVREAYTSHMLGTFANIAENTEGAVAYYLRYNPEFASPVEGFFWSKEEGEPDFKEYPPTDLLAYPPEDAEHVGWYYIPVGQEKPTWVMPYQNRNNNCFMISYVIPLYAEDILLGVVGLDIAFQDIMTQIDNVKVYETGYAYLVDETDTIVYHKDLPPGDPRPDTSKKMLENETRLENGMRLVVTVDRMEIYHDRNSMAVEMIILCTIAAAVFIIITILLTRRLIRPLRELTAATEKMKSGEFDFDFSQTTDDEVGKLTESLQITALHLQDHMNQITGIAYRDSLTGVKNAAAYKDSVHQLELEMQCGDAEYAVVVLDVNDLKLMNDLHGHKAGDALIVAACRLICRIYQHSPVFRIGGDEFAVFLKGSDYAERHVLLDRLDEEMQRTFVEIEDGKLAVSIARGMAVYDAEQFSTYGDVFIAADSAMYQNKAEYKKRMAKEQ